MKFLEWCAAHPETIAMLVSMIVALIKGQNWLAEKKADARLQRIRGMAQTAFWAVEEVSRLNPELKGLAKGAEFLKRLDDALLGHGDAPLAAAEIPAVSDMARALNAVQKAASAVPMMASPLK